MPAAKYQLWLANEALRLLLSLRSEERTQLDRMFELLTGYPFTQGDYSETDADGFTNNVLLKGRFLVTFRADHAAREMRLIRVERA